MTKCRADVNSDPMNAPQPDPRRAAILDAAWTAFARYGFRKTSMEDIARGAGLSRPALYQYYRNKEDIFRSLAAHYIARSVQDVERELAADRPVPEALAEAFARQGEAIAEVLLTSPHGHELLDIGNATSADIVAEGEVRIAAAYAAWLRGRAAAGALRPGLDPDALGATFVAALHGIKAAATDHAGYLARARMLGRVLGQGLLP
ncbi:MAG: TetR family transcriptional regulator [Rhodobacteraceae bacterium HLUCCA08]|nr:MAG: TetR family transcriptional regulator [Rhodobacteraceae bacterium HLUCCA08]